MVYVDVLTFVIEDGIEAAKASYARPDQHLKRAGAMRGFEDCRDKTPDELALLLQSADRQSHAALRQNKPDYWYWRCRTLEIAWACNVVSAILCAQGLPAVDGSTITMRGALKAAEIIGIGPGPAGT